MDTEVQINPKMVTLARQTRGLSQKDLSEIIGISPSMLSNIENAIGHIPLKMSLVNNLVNSLDFNIKFFEKEGKACLPSSGYFRRHKSVSKKDMDQAVGQMNIIIFMVDKYLEMIDVPDLNIIDWDVELQGSPLVAAQNLRTLWGVQRGRIQNLSKLIEDNGIFVVECDFKTDKIDGFSIQSESNGRPLIFVNSNYTEDRKRLTVAHELGHIILHLGRYDISQYRDVEEEAFDFASEFLVPLKEFKSQLGCEKLTIAKLGHLKQYWRTSMKSFVFKSQKYNLITNNQARYLYQKLAPYRKKEPIELQQQERPSLFGEMIYTVETELMYSKSELSEMVGLNEPEFSRLRIKAMKNLPKLRVA